MPDENNELLNRLLKYCSQVHATDLHICAGSMPLMRMNSKLNKLPDTEVMLPPAINAIVDSLLDDKKKASLTVNRVIDFSFSRPGLGRFRCNIYQQRGSYAIAIRTLPFEIPTLASLGLPPVVETMIHKNKGLILATGATGSGKSTTLASLIDIINEKYSYHIVTIEDPVEYLHRHKASLVTQREIGEDADSFAIALRSALREDPDVIMVGEMRDPETISIALTAAETGHLVLSTLHTVGAAKAIDRIIDAFPAGQQAQVKTQLATVIEGIISQQLLPRTDEHGLVLASEVMLVTPAIRNLIREGKHYQVNSAMQTGQSMGMQMMEADLARLVKDKLIDLNEASLRATDPQLLNQFLRRE
jgi:twitching motility protein PilT